MYLPFSSRVHFETVGVDGLNFDSPVSLLHLGLTSPFFPALLSSFARNTEETAVLFNRTMLEKDGTGINRNDHGLWVMKHPDCAVWNQPLYTLEHDPRLMFLPPFWPRLNTLRLWRSPLKPSAWPARWPRGLQPIYSLFSETADLSHRQFSKQKAA